MNYFTVKEIKERITELTAKNQQVFNEAGPEMDLSRVKCLEGDTTAKVAAVKAVNDELADLTKKLKELNDLSESRRAINASLGYAGAIRNDPSGGQITAVKDSKDKSFRGMFGYSKNEVLDNMGFKNFNEFLKVLSTGLFDQRLVENKVHTEGAPTGGGYSVPTQYTQWLLDASLESEIVRPRATVYPMTTEFTKIPSWDAYNHTSTLYGGFAGTWLTENTTASKTTGLLRLLQLTAYKLGIYTQASRELVQDGISFEEQLGVAFTKAIGWYLDYAFFNGNGVNQPSGIIADSSIITASRSGTSHVSYTDCVNMFARLHPSCLSNAVWIANQKCVPDLMTMTIITGTSSGAFVPAVQQSNGQLNLLTKPILLTEKLPALGTKGDFLLVDLSQYAVGMRQDLILDRSNAPGWTEDLIDYRAIVRVDGKPMWKSAVTPKTGDTLSWCVCLETK